MKICEGREWRVTMTKPVWGKNPGLCEEKEENNFLAGGLSLVHETPQTRKTVKRAASHVTEGGGEQGPGYVGGREAID